MAGTPGAVVFLTCVFGFHSCIAWPDLEVPKLIQGNLVRGFQVYTFCLISIASVHADESKGSCSVIFLLIDTDNLFVFIDVNISDAARACKVFRSYSTNENTILIDELYTMNNEESWHFSICLKHSYSGDLPIRREFTGRWDCD